MSALLVVCLCAEWCGTCRDYRPEFEALQKEFGQHRFAWIDIEDDSDLVADVDIENFPTLLITRESQLLFAGTLLPHISHLRRLLQSLDENVASMSGNLPPDQEVAFRALAARLAKEQK